MAELARENLILQAAALEFDSIADDLRRSSTIPDAAADDWCGDVDAQAQHTRLRYLAERLSAIAARRQGGQRRQHSAAEAMLNVAVGYVVSLAAQMLIFPLLGINVGIHENIIIGLLFTVINLVRSYGMRRFCNRYLR